MEDLLHVLDLADRGELPETIDETTSALSFPALQQLIQAGHITALDASTHAGTAYVQPTITVSGREYLRELRRRRQASRSISPEPPTLLKNVQWFLDYGRRHLRVILLAGLVLVVIAVLRFRL